MYIIKESNLLSPHDIVKYYNLEDELDNLNDIWIKWHNNNSISAIEKLIKSTKYRQLCKLLFYVDEILSVKYSDKAVDLNAFENYNRDIIVYRGGSGIFDKSYSMPRKWISVTASKDRLNTFSVYSGTHTSSAYMLDKNEHYWQIEIKIKLNDILAYYDVGDHEAIVSSDNLKNAKLIKQT